MGLKITEELALVASIPPAVATANTYNSDVIDLSKFHQGVVFTLLVGAYGASGATIDMQIYANTANSTSGGTAITGKSFTDATFSGSAAGTNKEGLINVTPAEVAAALAGARYCYAVVTVGTNTVAFALAVHAAAPRYTPASDYDLSSVAEIVS